MAKTINHHIEPWINPYQLLQKMEYENIEYGYHDFTNKININPDHELFHNWEYIENNCYVLHPKEVWRYKIGTCWDCSMMEWYWCKRIPYIDPHVFFVEGNKKDDTNTHTILYYHDTKYGRWYMMEYAWHTFKGFYGPYKSKYDLFKLYLDNFIHKMYNDIICMNLNVDIKSLYKQPRITFNDFYTKCHENSVKTEKELFNEIEKGEI